MSTPYEATGRTEQKRRTRDALVAAARGLVVSGITPTVEQAAAAAAISRPTAYRYFPNQRALLAAAHPETAAETLLPADAPEDPAARLAAVITTFTRMVVESESQQRTMLRLSLEADPAERAALYLRQGRAIGWIEEALAPLRGQLSDEAIHNLVLAIRSAVGIEALSWLTDVAKLSRDEAVGLMSWTAQALLYSALNGRTPEET
jgi:AcrR family transcriptional regulator